MVELSLKERKEKVNNIKEKILLLKEMKKTGDKEKINNCGNDLLKDHIEFLRRLNFLTEINKISTNDHNEVSLETLEVLIMNQVQIIEEIEKSKKFLENNLSIIDNYFSEQNLNSEVSELLNAIEQTLCSSNKIVRKKARKVISEKVNELNKY